MLTRKGGEEKGGVKGEEEEGGGKDRFDFLFAEGLMSGGDAGGEQRVLYV